MCGVSLKYTLVVCQIYLSFFLFYPILSSFHLSLPTLAKRPNASQDSKNRPELTDYCCSLDYHYHHYYLELTIRSGLIRGLNLFLRQSSFRNLKYLQLEAARTRALEEKRGCSLITFFYTLILDYSHPSRSQYQAYNHKTNKGTCPRQPNCHPNALSVTVGLSWPIIL